jgi:hypothetical protein
LVTRLYFAAAARGLLAVHFSAPDRTLGEAAAIFTHNARIMLATVGLAYYAARVRERQIVEEHPVAWLGARVIDGVLLAGAASQVILAGVLLGAYGSQQVRAFMPYAPVEIVAWLVILALYLRARRRQIQQREATIALACGLLLLALAAALEAFVGSA